MILQINKYKILIQKKKQKLIKKLHEFIRLMTFYFIYFPFRILEN